MSNFDKLVIGESPYPGNKQYEKLTISAKCYVQDFSKYIEVIGEDYTVDDTNELVVAFVPKFLVRKKRLESIASFRRVLCMVYGSEYAQEYINQIANEIGLVPNENRLQRLKSISLNIAKKLHDDGIGLLNVLSVPPSAVKRYNLYNDNMFEYCNTQTETKVLLLGWEAIDAWDEWAQRKSADTADMVIRDDILKYYHPSGRNKDQEKWKGIDYNNSAKLSTVEEVKMFSLG